MSLTYARKGDRKYLYYLCLDAIKRNRQGCPTKSVSANKIEDVVLSLLRQLSKEKKLEEKLWAKLTLQEKVALVRSLVKEVDYSGNNSMLGLVLQKDQKRHEFPVSLRDLKNLPAIKRDEIRKEPKLRQNLALAHQIDDFLDNGKISDVRQLTGYLNMSHVRINQIMGMTLLAPTIQEEILLSSRPEIFQMPEYKMNELVKEVEWSKQTEIWQKLLAAYSDKSETSLAQ
jgi:hypothetical protein